MSDRNERESMDLLNLSIDALQTAPVPVGPLPELMASTVEAVNALNPQPDHLRLRQRRKRMFRMIRYGGLAASITLLAMAFGLWLLDRNASVALAFGDVVENVKKAKSVTFVTKIPTVVQGNQRGALQQKFYIQGPAYRMEIPSTQEGAAIPPDAPPVLMAMIADFKTKRVLQLNFVGKTAQWMDSEEKVWQEMAKGLANPIEQLRQLKEQDAEKLGEELLDGRRTLVYRLTRTDIFMGLTFPPGETAKLWVDPQSGLPVRIAVGDPSDPTKPFIVFEQFTWNEALDPSLFKLDAPAGFTVVSK